MVTGRIVRVPLEFYRVRGIDFALVRVVLVLKVRTESQTFEEVRFTVDMGAGITSMAITKANELRIPVPQKVIDFSLQTATGKVRQRRHPGPITVRVPGLEGREFIWPCHFVEHRGDPPRTVLGLAGVLNDLRITLDGRYAQEAPYGWLVLEELVAR